VTPQPVVFRSKVDRWIVAILMAALAVSLWATVAAIGTGPTEGWIGAAIILGSYLFVAAVSIPTRYIVTERDLIIRSGFLRTRIALTSINRVYPTRNPIAAPAWSLDRLGIAYRAEHWGGLALISPARRGEFMALLQDRAGLDSSDSELVRSGSSPASRR
jgi:hypothetical protein